jgi:hypothetical protein
MKNALRNETGRCKNFDSDTVPDIEEVFRRHGRRQVVSDQHRDDEQRNGGNERGDDEDRRQDEVERTAPLPTVGQQPPS